LHGYSKRRRVALFKMAVAGVGEDDKSLILKEVSSAKSKARRTNPRLTGGRGNC